MNPRIVVVGGLAAGPSAASKAKRVNPNADVMLLEQGEHVSYGICEIPYFIGSSIRGEDLEPFTPERLARDKGVSVRTLHRVEAIHPSKRHVTVRDLSAGKTGEIPYDRLILATGARPRTLGLPGEQARNVFAIRTLSGAHALKRYLAEERPRRSVIIGGGYIGMEMCEALAGAGLEVTLLHRGDLPMSGLERKTRTAVLETLTANSITFRPGQTVREFQSDSGGRISGVLTNTGLVPTELVVECLGITPNSELAVAAGIRTGVRGGIMTDQRQSTNLRGIYAAGDCCAVRNLVTNRAMYIPLATTASKQGWVAGENAAGGRGVFKGVVRAIGVKVFGLEVAQVGISSAEAEEAGYSCSVDHIEGSTKVASYPGNERTHIITLADRKSGRLLGANVYGGMGSVLRANVLSAAIQHRLTLDEVASLDLVYSPPFSPLWDPILIAGRSGSKTLRRRRS